MSRSRMRPVGIIDANELLERTGEIYDLCNDADKVLDENGPEAAEKLRALIKRIRDINTKNNFTAGFMQMSFNGEFER